MMQSELPPVVPPPPAPSPAVAAFKVKARPTTRTDVQIKLLYHLELAFGGAPVPSHGLPKHQSYLLRVIAIHFGLQAKLVHEAILTSATLGELSDRIADLLNLPREQLF